MEKEKNDGVKELEKTVNKKEEKGTKYRTITGEFPPVLKFTTAGEQFTGKLIKIETITIKKSFFKFRKKATYIILESKSSKKQYLIWATAVLKFLLIKSTEKPNIGDTILITYKGKITEKGRSRHEFDIKVAI